LLRSLFTSRESDGRLQHALEQLPGAIFLVVPRTGQILAVNGRAAALTEWTRDELLHLALAEVVAAPLAAEALELIHHLEAGHSRSLNAVTLRTRSGRPALVDLRLSAQPELVNGELQVLVQALPAEERLALEREHAQQTQSYDALQALLALLSEPSEAALEQAVDLVRLMTGADAAALYQVSPGQPGLRQLRGTPLPPGQKPLPPALGPSEAQYLKTPHRWAASQRPEGYLHQAARAGGWGNLLAHPIGDPPAIVGALCAAYLPGSLVPATAQRQLAVGANFVHQLTLLIGRQAGHDRSRDLAVRLTAQVSAVNAVIEEGVVLLNRGGTLDEINGAAARMLGYRSEEVTGLPFTDVLIADDPFHDLVRKALEQAEATFSHECRLLRRSGEGFHAVVRARPLPAGGCVVTIRDQSEVKANAVRQEHLDQLAYVGQATQSFAHEVRGPLNGIAMGVQYLAKRLSADEELAGSLSKIQAECTRLSLLMNDMLAWAKPVTPNLQPTDLDGVLRRLLNRFGLKMEQRNVRLNYLMEPNTPQVLADPRLLDQVFNNLIDNALQAMPAGGQLSVNLGFSRRGPGETSVEAKVADTGPGMTDDARRQVFDPYFTTKPDGTGLGLAICKRLVTIHRGAIGVESFAGSGTIFTVTLPGYQPPVANPEVP
jgi:two-component system nitrogen regulation sensor histidine kinase GlnL